MLKFQKLGILIYIIQPRRTEYTGLPQEQWSLKSPTRKSRGIRARKILLYYKEIQYDILVNYTILQ
jgi:hypothetical protein